MRNLLVRIRALQAENAKLACSMSSLRCALTEEQRAVGILLTLVELADAELAGRRAN